MLSPFPKPRLLQRIKSPRLPRRKLVTLFAGFRCSYQPTPEDNVFVVCADSQETIEDKGHSYRVTLQKIKPRKCGNFEIAIGGSSLSGELLDACVHRVEESVTSFTGSKISELKGFISRELLDFGRKDAKLFSVKERVATLLIMARSIPESRVECWHTRATQLLPVERKILVGWDEKLYKHILDRLYPEVGPLLPPQQAVLLGMHVLKLAEDTSNYVRGPVTVLVAHRAAIMELPREKVQKFQERIDIFLSQVDHILLSLSDNTIRRSVYEAKLDEFKATVLQLRDDYVQESAPKSVEEIMTRNDVIPDFPIGGVIYKFGVNDPPIVNENPADVARWQKKIELVKIRGGAGPVKLTVHCQCTRSFEVELPNYQAIFGREFDCECGQKTTVTGVKDDDIKLTDSGQNESKA
jgi:hypothetical protein